jgi:ribosomal protein S17E
MRIEMVKDIYNELISNFPDTLEKTSEDVNKSTVDKYMTLCKKTVVNVDKFIYDFVKNMSLTSIPKSCDALYMTPENEYFMIEFKNGKIEAKINYEINVKILESLLMLSEKFTETIAFTRNNMNFILVYNENIEHGQEQYDNTRVSQVSVHVFKRAHISIIRFGLHRFKKLYFKNVFTYTKSEFQSEFVSTYCI